MFWAQMAETERKEAELWGPVALEMGLPLRDIQCSIIHKLLPPKGN